MRDSVHTECVLHKDNLYKFLYTSPTQSKQIIYEHKNEVHSLSFSGKFCKHTIFLNWDETSTFFIVQLITCSYIFSQLTVL